MAHLHHTSKQGELALRFGVRLVSQAGLIDSERQRAEQQTQMFRHNIKGMGMVSCSHPSSPDGDVSVDGLLQCIPARAVQVASISGNTHLP